MLAQAPDLDAVAICTPPQAHYEAAKLALAQGKHVLLEKPPCTSLTQFEQPGAAGADRGPHSISDLAFSARTRRGSRGAAAAATNSEAGSGDLEGRCTPMASGTGLDL